MNGHPTFGVYDPLQIIHVLAEFEVEYVLIGATAARLQGFPRMTADADITPSTSTENLGRLARALRKLKARIYVDGIPEGIPFEVDAKSLARADMWNLVTAAGRLDVIFKPLGTDGYDDLQQNAVEFRVGEDVMIAASITDIIRCKRASNRVQDRADIPVLEEMLRKHLK